MAITSARAATALKEFFDGTQSATHSYKALLIKTGHTGNYNGANTNVGTPGTGTPGAANVGTDEVSSTGTGYPAGGIPLGSPNITLQGGKVCIDFSDPSPLTNCNFSADGAVIYDTSNGRILTTISFGSAKAPQNNGSFTLDLPTAGATTSLIRYPA